MTANPRSSGLDDQEFWEQRPSLRHIRRAAHARFVSAPAVLAVLLARVIAETSPRLTLPPLIGSDMSLNSYVALLGRSGSGKTSVMAVVEDLYPWTVGQQGVGSGEGLLRGYGRVSGGVWSQDRTSQFLYVDEVVTLTAQASRSGSTLLGLINTAWTGQTLSQQYANQEKNALIPRHGYRLCLVVGVQLGKADNLLSHSDAGTPQRFCWAPMIDPSIPVPGQEPKWPGELKWRPVQVDDKAEVTHIGVPSSVANRVRRRFQERVTSWDYSGDDRDHDDLLRLKLAAALALLDARIEIETDDWKIAGMLMRQSTESLAMVYEERAERARRRAQDSGRFRGNEAFAASQVEEQLQEQSLIERTSLRIARHVHKDAVMNGKGWCVKKCAKNGLSKEGLLKYFDAAVEHGVEQGWILVSDSRGRKLIPADTPPPARNGEG